MTIEEEVKALDTMIDETRRRLNELTARRRDLLLDALGVKVGDIVRNTEKDPQWKEGKIAKIDTIHGLGQKPWVDVFPRKKDGSFSLAARCAYKDWEKAE